jgi:hypothetical protein
LFKGTSRAVPDTLHTEQVPPQKKVWRYPQIRLTKMDEHRHYSNGVRDEMYQLQFVVEKETSEEISSGDVEATLEERREDDLLLHIFGRELLPHRRFPLHLCLRPQ